MAADKEELVDKSNGLTILFIVRVDNVNDDILLKIMGGAISMLGEVLMFLLAREK